MRGLLLFLLLACWSCAPKSRQAGKSLVDIDGILQRQLDQLAEKRPALTKTASVNASESDTTFVPGREAWKSELEVFRTLGMVNQRIYADQYLREGPLDDPLSNLLIQQFTNQEAPLRRIRIYYQDEPERIRKVEGEVEESTPLYTATRRLSLWFEEDHNQLSLNRYEVAGYQKAALRDTVRFRVTGMIRW